MAGYEIRKKQLIKPYLDKLIKHLTDFKEEDLEFKQCENFALSHFLHHSYLSVNRHQVQRSIKGLVDKFFVHGFPRKAEVLEKLANKFVKSEHFKDIEEVDVEWSILLFLITMSDNPTSVVLQEDIQVLPDLPPLEAEHCTEEPFVDWGQYLKEGCDKFQLPDDEDDSTAWSELESDVGEEKEEEEEGKPEDSPSYAAQYSIRLPSEQTDKATPLQFNYLLNDKLPSPGSQQKPKDVNLVLDNDRILKVHEEKIISENLLKQSIQYNWWNDPSVRMEPESSHPAATFGLICENQTELETQGLIPKGHTKIISVYKLTREVLWILQVPVSTLVFSLTDEGKVVAKEDITVSSVASETLAAYLNSNVCCYSTMVHHLSQFIKGISCGESEIKKSPYTYISYAEVLHNRLLDFFSNVAKVQEKVEKQDTTCTLLSVIEELRPELHKLRYIYQLHLQVAYDWKRCEGWFCTVRLLGSLYQELCTCWNNEFKKICTELLIKSFKVYLQIIDHWLSWGELDDCRDEFIIKRHEGELKVVAYSELLKEIDKPQIIEIFDAIVNVSTEFELMKKMDQMSAMTVAVEKKESLYAEFIEAIGAFFKKYFGTDNETAFKTPCNFTGIVDGQNGSGSYELHSMSELSHSISVPPTLCCDAAELDAQWHKITTEKLIGSSWLMRAFKTTFEHRTPTQISQKKDQYRIFSEEISRINIDTIPMYHLVKHNLMSLLTDRQQAASKVLIKMLTTTFKLEEHLSFLGSVFILEAAHVLQPFYDRVFSLNSTDNLQTINYSLNLILEECVESIVKQDLANAIKFSVCLTSVDNINFQNIMDHIFIDYEVEQPVSLIITKESLNTYNSIFRFLLKLEQAVTSIHHLRFCDIKTEKKTDQIRVRTLYKVRMFLMQCIDALRFYFVAFTPRDLREELKSAMSDSSSVQDIINAHKLYLRKLKKHCLLDDGNIVMVIIRKIFVANEDFCNCWAKQSQASLTSDELSVVEENYTNAHVGLHICLTNYIEKHPTPPLIMLGASIESCLPVSPLLFSGSGDQSF